MPSFGYCKELSGYSPLKTMFINTQSIPSSIFITDPRYKNYYSLDFASHQGAEISSNVMKGIVDVNVNIYSRCQISSMVEDDFEKCVDDEIQKEIGIPLGCVPPWLSSLNQCNDIYNSTFYEPFGTPKFHTGFTNPVLSLGRTDIEKLCRKSCLSTTSTINLHTVSKGAFLGVQINLDEKVKVTETVFNYDLFESIIDAESCLGLWLRLSMLSLYGVLEDSIAFIRKYAPK